MLGTYIVVWRYLLRTSLFRIIHVLSERKVLGRYAISSRQLPSSKPALLYVQVVLRIPHRRERALFSLFHFLCYLHKYNHITRNIHEQTGPAL
jgi:hypothetical protein